MATEDRPKFTELYKSYLAAVNGHSLEETFSFLSPSLACYYQGQLRFANREETIGEYQRHWKETVNPVLLRSEPKELEDDYGVEVDLVDYDSGYTSTVRYIYAFEDGKWLHVRNEVITADKLDETKEQALPK